MGGRLETGPPAARSTLQVPHGPVTDDRHCYFLHQLPFLAKVFFNDISLQRSA